MSSLDKVHAAREWTHPTGPIVHLNLGLGPPTSQEDKMSEGTRKRLYIAQLRFLFAPDSAFSIKHVVGTTEDVLVVIGRLRNGVTYKDIHDLAVLANQDCIALYEPGQDVGHILGPFPGPYGDFDMQYFIKP